MGEYITLLEASKLCSYSEPYLRLRARQGKFKSIKFGKKWMTTTQWIEDYVKKTKEWNEKIAAKKTSVSKEESDVLAFKEELNKAGAETVPVLPSFEAVLEAPKEETKKEAAKETANKEVSGSQVFDLALIAGSGLMFASLIFFAVAADGGFFKSVPEGTEAALGSIARQLPGQQSDLPDFVCPNSIATSKDGQEILSSSAVEAKQDPLEKAVKKAVAAINNFRFPWEAR